MARRTLAPTVIKDNGTQIDAFGSRLRPEHVRPSNLGDGVHTLGATRPMRRQVDDTVVTISVSRSDRQCSSARSPASWGAGTIGQWNFWKQRLVNGNGRFTFANSIERSTEARTLTLNDWYQVYLGRAQAPKSTEIQFWINAFNNGASEEQVLSSLLASAEYYNRAPSIPGVTAGTPSDSAFIQALFIQLLTRKASSSDISFFVNLLPKIGRQQLAFAILTSAEYRGNQVNTYYGPTLLGRSVPPSPQEVGGWVNSGLDLTSIRVSFLATPEYFFRVTGLQT